MFLWHHFMIIYLDLTVHGGGEQEMTRAGKQSDGTDTLKNTQRETDMYLNIFLSRVH